MNDLRGKSVLVTGGSSGIGQAIAVSFGQEGSHIAINYLRVREEAQQTEGHIHEAYERCVVKVRACGVRVSLVQADVSCEEEVQRMIRATVEELGGLDVLINNAGIQIAGDSHEMTADEFDTVLAVNLRGAFLCAREAIRHWLGTGHAGRDRQHQPELGGRRGKAALGGAPHSDGPRRHR